MCGPRGLPSAPNILYHNHGGGKFEDVSASPAASRKPTATTASPSRRSITTTTAGPTSTSPATPPQRSSTTTTMTAPSPTRPRSGRSLQRRWPRTSRHGLNFRRLRRRRQAGPLQDQLLGRHLHPLPQQRRRHIHRHDLPAGLGVNSNALGWGAMFADVDNDGWPDLLVVNGHVYPEVDPQLGSFYREPRFLYHNLGNGKFRDVRKPPDPASMIPAPAAALPSPISSTTAGSKP